MIGSEKQRIRDKVTFWRLYNKEDKRPMKIIIASQNHIFKRRKLKHDHK